MIKLSQISLHQDFMQPCSQLRTLTHNYSTWRGFAVVNFAPQSTLSDVLDWSLEGHPEEGTWVVRHPVSVHRLYIASKSHIISDQIQVPVVDTHTVGSEEGNHLRYQHVPGCLDLCYINVTPNFLAIAWMSLLLTLLQLRKGNLGSISKLTPSVWR